MIQDWVGKRAIGSRAVKLFVINRNNITKRIIQQTVENKCWDMEEHALKPAGGPLGRPYGITATILVCAGKPPAIQSYFLGTMTSMPPT